jgi:hypothetical protein
MNKPLVVLLGALALHLTASAAPDSLAREFASPGPDLRGKPFWSWNGDLEESELKRQIGVLKGMGMGGYFMHSRTGLRTEYLGDEWFRLINACADQGQKKGMESWLYDEDRWPSGTAGGRVTMNPAFRAKFLSLRTVPAVDFKWSDDLVAVFAADLKGTSYSNCTRLNRDTTATSFAGKTVLAFTVEEMNPSSFFNGYTDVNRLNRAATDEFIRLTHEQYKARCGDRLGTSIKGIFTDEPHRGPAFSGFGLDNTNRLRMTPWSADLPAVFQKRFGYDLIGRLPELFLYQDGQKVAQVKWQYMEQLQTMFIENWARPIQDWCRSNHMIFTGHFLHEDSLTCQTAPQGSLMRAYEYLDWPGVDVLSEGNRNYWIVKQVSSVARQLGQKRILSELYGCTGWQFNFESHKYVGDWQALFGVNLRCQHLSWYTMGAEAKRDYPASIFFQSAWWPDYPVVEDYFTRLNVLLAQGQPACDVLVVNPVESMWCQVGVGWATGLSANAPETKAVERAYTEIFAWLAGSHVDFDYGDEEMMSRLARVERDADGAPILRVGQAPYRVVIIPKMTTIRSSTLKLLEQFRQAGGKVVAAGDAPEYVDALKSPAAADLAAKSTPVKWNRDAVIAACRSSLRYPVEISDAAGKTVENVFCQLRMDGDRAVLVAMNMEREQAFTNVTVRVKTAGQVAEWDCATGRRFAVPSKSAEGWTEWRTDFLPVGEHAYVINRQAEPGLQPRPVLKEVSRTVAAGPFAYRLSEPNVCVLDLARYRIGDGSLSEEIEVLKVDQAVRKHFDLPLRGGQMVQPWYSKKFEPEPATKGQVTLAFGFELEEIPAQGVELAIEQPQWFRIALNGKPLESSATSGWWVDPAIQKIVVPAGLLVRGSNTLELVTDFRQDRYFEALYLLGNFGVNLDGTKKHITRLPEKLLPSDLTAQGLPFYSGGVTYEIPVANKLAKNQQFWIETPKFEAACLKAGPAAFIAWQPYCTEVTDSRRDGVVELTAMLTRRNSFGPLHQLPLRTGSYGPGNWVTTGKFWSQNYQLYPAGLLEAPVISLREEQK